MSPLFIQCFCKYLDQSFEFFTAPGPRHIHKTTSLPSVVVGAINQFNTGFAFVYTNWGPAAAVVDITVSFFWVSPRPQLI